MRKDFIKIIVFFFFIAGSVNSCKPEEVVQPELTIAKEELSFSNEAGKSMLAIKTNVKWSVSSNESWCSLSPVSGEPGTKQIAVSVSKNESVTMREALITVVAGSLSKKVKVTQAQNVIFSLSPKEFNLTSSGGDITVSVQASQDVTSAIQADWITQKSISADKKTLVYTIAENKLNSPREGTITFTSGTLTEIVTVRQAAKDLSIPPDNTGMANDAKAIAKKIHLGWNLGNTLEAIGGETAWGNPKATQLLIDSVKAAGFNAVRLPCAWNGYLENQTNYKIKDFWLTRVKEVVDYCIKNDMYVILNIHWDGGWLENNVTTAKQAENNAKQRAIWEQIAVYFRNYDEHLLFASANEPNVANATEMAVLMSYHQTFVNAVRSTGGRNAYRILVIQGPATDIEKTNTLMVDMPVDNVTNRMMAEIHYYTPWNFCGLDKDESWGKMFYYWGTGYHSATDTGRNATWGEETEMNRLFGLMKTRFVNKGIPVILGEFGVMKRNLTGDNLTLHLASRAYYYEYMTKQAKNNGLIPFLWDTGIHNSNDMGIFVRSTGSVSDRQAYNALMKGASAGVYPF